MRLQDNRMKTSFDITANIDFVTRVFLQVTATAIAFICTIPSTVEVERKKASINSEILAMQQNTMCTMLHV